MSPFLGNRLADQLSPEARKALAARLADKALLAEMDRRPESARRLYAILGRVAASH